MTPTPSKNPAVIEAGRIIAERTLEEVKDALLDSFCLTLNQAAGIVGLSPENTNRLAKKYNALIDLGPRAKRVTVAGLRRIILEESTKKKLKP
jgi:hypothetical protein